MKGLFLLRHAKSSWTQPDLSDFDRPLNERGLRTAPFMGELIKKYQFEPAIILSSPARRAKETAELVKLTGSLKAEVQFEDRIYEASPQALVQVASEIDDSSGSAMIVGHNPGIEGFIRFLTGAVESMPTAALAVIDLDIDRWAQLQSECGNISAIYRPKDVVT
ncbi:MAG: histidine phosphatase family protein [Pyrinomonadaceae bacterium]